MLFGTQQYCKLKGFKKRDKTAYFTCEDDCSSAALLHAFGTFTSNEKATETGHLPDLWKQHTRARTPAHTRTPAHAATVVGRAVIG